MIRTIHHQAGTGGTVISRCLAAKPGVTVLSEISPAARPLVEVRYDPLNILSAFLRQNPQIKFSRDSLYEHFGEQLRFVSSVAAANGLALVIRDHSHSGYMTSEVSPVSPLLACLRGKATNVVSIVTVRYPFSSYVSFRENKWDTHVSDYDKYCQRYITFIEHHAGLQLFKYEDFCLEPEIQMETMTAALSLKYDASFSRKWPSVTLSGNSGRARAARTIRPLVVKGYSASMRNLVAASAPHRRLCDLLGYPADLATFAQRQAEQVLALDPSNIEAHQALDQLRKPDRALASDGKSYP